MTLSPTYRAGIIDDAATVYIRVNAAMSEMEMNPMPNVVLESTLTCPQCGFRKGETMPTDACQYFYECTNCKALLKPKAGDCCVFCSFGTVRCPPVQQQRSCCS